MRGLAFLISLTMCGPMAAQLLPPNEAGVTMGHIHLNVRDVEAHRKFWVDQIGAKVVKLGNLEAFQIPGLLVLARKREPTGPVAGSVVNHVGLKVVKLDALLAKFKAAGTPYDEPVIGRENTPQTYVTGPDEFRMELVEDPTLKSPVVSHHLHYYLTEPDPVREWYVKHMLVKSGMRGPYISGDIPGMNLTFAPNRESAPPVPTKGRVLDHIGFEVKNLEAFCKRLEEAGVKLDSPYRKTPDLAWAFVTDPWGVYIELSEGLDRMK
jgi:catechol 2,3-dioxygenase-like lactoylglutathione lyase family enzyme